MIQLLKHLLALLAVLLLAPAANGGSKGTLTALSADDWLAVIAKEATSAK